MDTLTHLLLILQTSLQCPSSFDAHHLFEAMQGHWTGKGTSTWESNQQVTHFRSETFSTRTARGLISKNTWTTEDSGKVSTSTYVIAINEKNPCLNGKYQYQLTVTEQNLAGTGLFDGSLFESIQPLPGGYSVVTRSRFIRGHATQVSRLVDSNQGVLSTTQIDHEEVK